MNTLTQAEIDASNAIYRRKLKKIAQKNAATYRIGSRVLSQIPPNACTCDCDDRDNEQHTCDYMLCAQEKLSYFCFCERTEIAPRCDIELLINCFYSVAVSFGRKGFKK